MQIQVDRAHYDFGRYVDEHRWNSYYYQIKEGLSGGNNVLIIGVGDGIVADILSKFGKNVNTFDFDPKLKPDIVGSVTKIDEVLNKNYDTVLCCQVLEHIPFEEFEHTIKRISRCTRSKFVLSLPNNNIKLDINVSVPKLPKMKVRKLIRRPFQKPYKIEEQGNGEHYWEIGAKGYSERKIIAVLKKYFIIEKRYIPSDNMYHIFYILKPR